MKITKAGWAALTTGEKMAILDYAVFESRKKWERRSKA